MPILIHWQCLRFDSLVNNITKVVFIIAHANTLLLRHVGLIILFYLELAEFGIVNFLAVIKDVWKFTVTCKLEVLGCCGYIESTMRAASIDVEGAERLLSTFLFGESCHPIVLQLLIYGASGLVQNFSLSWSSAITKTRIVAQTGGIGVSTFSSLFALLTIFFHIVVAHRLSISCQHLELWILATCAKHLLDLFVLQQIDIQVIVVRVKWHVCKHLSFLTLQIAPLINDFIVHSLLVFAQWKTAFECKEAHDDDANIFFLISRKH
jgi:hypothetical protein